MLRKKSQSGQALVETAIVMPLNLFIILGVIQFGLISQARYVAKYAAYRAVRVGAMNHADPKKMTAAAEAALLPVIAMPMPTGLDVIGPTTGLTEVGTKAAALLARNLLPSAISPKMVEVTVCGPLKNDVNTITERHLNGSVGSDKEVDFDDPRVNYDDMSNIISASDEGTALGDKLRRFEANKLRVQVKFNYRMPIPFANWAISKMYLGMMTPDVLRFGKGSPFSLPLSQLKRANKMGIYIAPIFESYAMRMQSNFYLGKFPLPNTDECVTYAHANSEK